MAIKPEAYEIHFAARSKERALAHLLDDAFEVTFGARDRELSFWFADPKRHTRERFGLRQEVLVIYSEHSKTDARVLRLIEEVASNRKNLHRLDPVLALLIHNGDPGETRELLRTDPNRVVVPFLASEISDATRGPLFVRLRMAEFFGEIDLFAMSSPITSDRYFFGRERLVQELVVRAASRSENSGVFGLRKTGKTSVLRAVERRLADRRVLPEFIDCHSPGIHAARWWQVLENIVERLVDRLHRDFRRTARVRLGYTETNAGARFSSDIQTILGDGDLERVLLMLDEVEFISPEISGELGRHWDSDFTPFWQTIRATHQESKGALVFLVAGVNPLSVQEPRFGALPNPIFQLAAPYFLEPFERSDVRDMVRTIGRYAGLKFDEAVYGQLTERYGGHPFLIRIACSEVWRDVAIDDPHKRVAVGPEDLDRLEGQIRTRIAQPLKDILLSLVWWYPEEYDLLQILAQGDTEFVSAYINAHSDSLVQFVKYGLLRDVAAVEFAIDDLKGFLREAGDAYKQDLSPFRRGDISPEVLPEVPDLETLARLFEKRCQLEIRLRKAIILYLGMHHNWEDGQIAKSIAKGLGRRPDRSDPAQLFVGRSPKDVVNQLYLLDLKAVVIEHWAIFRPLFDNHKSRFEMNMDTVNTARRVDAHTKPFTPDEITDFNNSYGWLLRKLDRLPPS